jgi:hypothetical protein
MAYQPSAEDFEDIEQGAYQPSADDFDEQESYIEPVGIKPQRKEETGFKGLYHDVVKSLANAIKSGKGFLKDTPDMLEDLGGDLLEHPGKAHLKGVGHVLAGAGELGKSVLNLPHDALSELGRKELIPEWLKKYNELPFTHIPEDTGVEKFLGLDAKRPGERLLHAVPEIATIGSGVKSLAKGAKNIATAPSKETLFKRALEQRIEEAAAKTGMSEAALKGLKESLRRDYSQIHGEKLAEVTPIGQEEAINVKQGKIQKLKPDTEIPAREIGEIPPEPDTAAIIEKQKSALQSAQKDAEHAVGILDNPRLKGGQKVKQAIEAVKQKASDLYNSARKHYVDQKIVADNGAEIKAITKDLNALKDADELAPGYGSGTAEQKALEGQLESLKGEAVNASDIFDLQRTLEKMAEDTRKKQYSGVNELEFKRLNGLAERLDSHASTLEKRLESVGGKDVQAMIKDANKGWKTYKDLSKRNPVGKAALKGELPTRSMVEIAKSHPGNDFLQALVESDPELKKHMLAAYAGESNVNKLLKPTSLAKKYIQDLPEVEEHVNALKQALTGVKEGEVQASKIKKEYNDLVTSMKDAAKEQKVRQDAIEQSDKLKKQIKFHEDAIPKLKEQMKKVDEHSAEHARLKKQLSDHEKQLADKNHLLRKYGNMALKATGVSALMGKIGL